MKRALIALMFLAACSPPAPTAEQETDAAPEPFTVSVRIDAIQNGQSVQVVVGQPFAVELPNREGLTWQATQTPDFLTVAPEGAVQLPPALVEPIDIAGLGRTVLYYTATSPGSGDFLLEQRAANGVADPTGERFGVTIVAQ